MRTWQLVNFDHLIYISFSDFHYYLSQQVHPVVMRLCEPFAELDASRIAEALGLDPKSYRTHAISQKIDYNIRVNLGSVLRDFKCSF
jgi:hypothetical protein